MSARSLRGPALVVFVAVTCTACLRFGYEQSAWLEGAGAAGSAGSNGQGGSLGGGLGSGGLTSGGDAGSAATPAFGGAAAGGNGANAGSPGNAGGAGSSGGSSACTSVSGCSCEVRETTRYLFCPNAAFRGDAEALCAGAELMLVRVDSAAENQWLRDMALQRGVLDGALVPQDFMHIGGSDSAVEGVWRWLDGTHFWAGASTGSAVNGLFNNWEVDNPKGSGVRDCAGMLANGKWEDRSCSVVARFVCKGP